MESNEHNTASTTGESKMQTFTWCTDAGQGTIDAESLEDALRAVCIDEAITEATLADGAFAWVENEACERLDA